MPIPTVITDLSTTAASNSPAGSDAPGPDGDNHIRALAAFIAQLYAGKTAIAAGVVISDGSSFAVGTADVDYLAPAAIGVSVQAYDADIPTVAGTAAEITTGTETALRSWAPDVLNDAINAVVAGQSILSYTGTGGITAEGAALATTDTIPGDDTKPQNTEGHALLDATITPSAAGVVIEVVVMCYVSLTGVGASIVALFRDSVASAVRSSYAYHAGAVYHHMIYRYTAPDTTAVTFKVRGGNVGAVTAYWNQWALNENFSDTISSYIKVTEL